MLLAAMLMRVRLSLFTHCTNTFPLTVFGAVVDTHGFPVLRDAVKARLSLTKEDESRLLEKWSAHSCLAWLANREHLKEPPDDVGELKYYALSGVPDEYRPDVIDSVPCFHTDACEQCETIELTASDRCGGGYARMCMVW